MKFITAFVLLAMPSVSWVACHKPCDYEEPNVDPTLQRYSEQTYRVNANRNSHKVPRHAGISAVQTFLTQTLDPIRVNYQGNEPILLLSKTTLKV